MDIATLKPCGIRVLVKLNPVKEMKTEGGIYIQDMHSEQTREGEILAVGDEVFNFFRNERIIISYNAGTVLHFPGSQILDDTLRVISQHEILAKIGG